MGLEIGLRLADWGYPTAFLAKRDNDAIYQDNDKYLWQYYSPKVTARPHAFAIPMAKPNGEVRILVVGESAAAGSPDPAYSFGRMLERMLKDRYPQRQIKVLNGAMRGVNSYIALAILEDCRRLQPDLVIVQLGNGEGLGIHAPTRHSGRWVWPRAVYRVLHQLRAMRTGELVEAAARSLDLVDTSAAEQNANFFQEHVLASDDPRRARVYRQFQANLADICRVARGAGASVILMTTPSNLKDCPPFSSVHGARFSPGDQARWESEYQQVVQAQAAENWEDALAHLAKARALDDHFAELHYRAGTCLAALGKIDQARKELSLARDWDALPLRADSRLNELVRRQVRALNDPAVVLVDAEARFTEAAGAPQGLPGSELFWDHAHPTFDGAYLLAQAVFPTTTLALRDRLGNPSTSAGRWLAREDCAKRLAFTPINEDEIGALILKRTAGAPFTGQLDHAQRHAAAQKRLAKRFGALDRQDLDAAVALYRQALEQAPEDWELHYSFARLLLLTRDNAGAIAEFDKARHLLPHAIPIRLGLTGALASAGRYEEALWQLNEALALDPNSESVKETVAAIRAQRPKVPR